MTRWQPTPALLRCAMAAMLGALAAVLAGRPELLVLAAPYAVLTLLALLARPAGPVSVFEHSRDRSMREGQGTVLTTTVRPTHPEDVEQVTQVVAAAAHVATRPRYGASSVSAAGDGEPLRVQVEVGPRRWGVRTVGEGVVAATSRWGGFRWGPVPLSPSTLVVLPVATPFDSAAEAPHPLGLVGPHRSSRNGTGTEFSGIRRFQAGDRLRRINWRTSLRTGDLHVVSTTSEEDSSVLLLVGALTDLGSSGGVDGAASTLDTTVRAAAALAEHHIRIGDRVSLRVIGRSAQIVGPGSGTSHHRRILETLARIRPGRPQNFDATQLQFRIPAGTVVLALAPLLSEEITTAIITLARRGLPVVAVDTAPDRVDQATTDGDSSPAGLAMRMRMLERELQVAEMVRTGTPVVHWRGPGTLDEVMRRLARRAQMPRQVAR